MTNLDTLAQHRDAILLAEIGAWLHDDFKHTDQQIYKYVNRAPSPSGQQDTSDLMPNIEIDFMGKKLNFSVVKNRKKDDFANGYLNRCHYTTHIEKEDGDSQQTYPARLSSPFGFEYFVIPSNLTNILRTNVPWKLIAKPLINRTQFGQQLQDIFSKVGGDTRRPGNEITLWEWGYTVGALYKASLVGAYFQHQLGPVLTVANDLHWRLLSIRTDGLAYFTNVSRLPDLVGRQKVFQEALDQVKTLLEETYPLGTEVYRDENGALYVVPDISNLLELSDNTGKTLLSHIETQFKTKGDICPQIILDSNSWWGQDPNRAGNDQIPPAGAILATKPTLQNNFQLIEQTWQGKKQEICSVCGLRPCVSREVEYCDVCRERRRGRATDWAENQNKTIWLDEVADSNGRLALITGTFDLTKWLDGSLVQTMLVKEPISGSSAVSKTPSFARLRRVWETTHTFWEQTQADINQLLTDSRRRLKIQLVGSPSLNTNQTYELDLLGQTRMAVFWDGKHLISIDNLSYIASQLGISLKVKEGQTQQPRSKTPDELALEVGIWLEKFIKGGHEERDFRLISDDEKKRQVKVQIQKVDYQEAAYTTTIPILAEPRTFMALVPADQALNILTAIKTKYEREMGKVRNRLPLHLGVVYAQRRTPLRAVLDSGRRMLKYKLPSEQEWQVVEKGCLRADELPADLTNGTKQFDLTVQVKLKNNPSGQVFNWYVPCVMGDGATLDKWYPYVFIKSDVSGRNLVFKGLRPKGDGTSEVCWLVHASELKAGDQVYFSPATFDFEWLDTAGRRFEIAYDKGQRRNGSGRPYLLDDLDTIAQIWQQLSDTNGLTSSQIYALLEVVESRRVSWKPTTANCQPPTETSPEGTFDCQPSTESSPGGTFWQFCHNVLLNAEWRSTPSREQLKELTDALATGIFADVIELYMSIMKK